MAFDYIPNEFARTWVAGQYYTKRGVHTPLAYIDINEGNRDDGYLFAQIMHWHSPNKETGQSRLETLYKGHLWITRKHSEWFSETRMRKEMVRISLRRIKERGLIFYELVGKKGQEIPYIRVNWAELERRLKLWLIVDSTAVEEETYQNFLDRCQYEEGAITPLVIWLPHHERYAHLFEKDDRGTLVYRSRSIEEDSADPVQYTPPPVCHTGDPVQYTPPPVCHTPSQAQNGTHIESLESTESLEQIPRARAHEGSEISFDTGLLYDQPAMNTSEGLPKPTMEDWEKAITLVWPSSGEKYWRNILNMMWGRSKKGEWADWNFEEKMQPKHPAEILAFKRFMATEEDENGELKYEKQRFPEKPDAIYKYWGFFCASKRFDTLVRLAKEKWNAQQAPIEQPVIETASPVVAEPASAISEARKNFDFKKAVHELGITLSTPMHQRKVVGQ